MFYLTRLARLPIHDYLPQLPEHTIFGSRVMDMNTFRNIGYTVVRSTLGNCKSKPLPFHYMSVWVYVISQNTYLSFTAPFSKSGRFRKN
jgi:hypothetical protein